MQKKFGVQRASMGMVVRMNGGRVCNWWTAIVRAIGRDVWNILEYIDYPRYWFLRVNAVGLMNPEYSEYTRSSRVATKNCTWRRVHILGERSVFEDLYFGELWCYIMHRTSCATFCRFLCAINALNELFKVNKHLSIFRRFDLKVTERSRCVKFINYATLFIHKWPRRTF